jgi:hypothetical protein
MRLREAIREAKEINCGIRRESELVWFIPTNTIEGIIAVTDHKLIPRWKPNSDDLASDEWEVYE